MANKPLARLTIGNTSMLLPKDSALSIMEMMTEAQPLEYVYGNDHFPYKRGRTLPAITMSLVSDTTLAVLDLEE